MTIFEEVKALVDMPTAARHYGVEVGRSNMAICPFHHECTPSMKLYEDHYYCFGCQAHGDVIHFVQQRYGLTPIEAVEQINHDLCLGLDVSKPSEREDIERIKQQKAEQTAYKEWENHAFEMIHRYLWQMRYWFEEFAPKDAQVIHDSRFVYALHHMGYAEYIAEEFLQGDKEKRLSMKEDIEEIERAFQEEIAGN